MSDAIVGLWDMKSQPRRQVSFVPPPPEIRAVAATDTSLETIDERLREISCELSVEANAERAYLLRARDRIAQKLA